MTNYTIVFMGTTGSGKSSAIGILSSEPLLSADESATNLATGGRSSQTVNMHHGVLNLSETDRVHFYGVSAIQSLDFVSETLSEGGLGLVLLVDNTRDDPFSDLDGYLTAMGDLWNKTALVIGVTHMDEKDLPTLRDFSEHLRARSLNCPIFEVDARNQRDVSILLQTLLHVRDAPVNVASCA